MKTDDLKKTSVLLETFKALLDATPGEFAPGKISVWDYSNPLHFDALWSAIENGALANVGKVLVVWSRTPLDESLTPINTAEHLSPLHWAACAAKETHEDQPPIQVAVLDLNPAAHQNEYLHKLVRSLERGRLRWLRLLQAAELFGELSSEGTFQAYAAVGDGETLKKRLFPQMKASQRNISPDLLRDRIREKLTSPSSPDDRHAIANIVGPMVLMNGAKISNIIAGDCRYVEPGFAINAQPLPGRNVSADHRLSLDAILRTIGLLPQNSCDLWQEISSELQRVRSHEEHTKKIADLVKRLPEKLNLRVTLVDDQWHHGWYEWLKSVFPPETAFTVCPDPQLLLDKLSAVKERTADLRFSFDLSPAEGKTTGKHADVLFLDLRLFSGNPIAEAAFYMQLLPLCRKFEVAEPGSLVPVDGPVAEGTLSRVTHLAWPGFSTRELEDAEAWIAGGGGRHEANHRVCLTLLPRLLALMDMTLPIVIFSSTGQRALVEAFQPYSNIITAFQKPHFFSPHQEHEIFHAAHDKLVKCLEHALAWGDLGRKCSEFMRLLPDCEEDNQPKSHRQGAGQPMYVELFIDETGEDRSADFAIGGVFAAFESSSNADRFDDIAVKNGLRYFRAGWLPPTVENRDSYPLKKSKDSGAAALAKSVAEFRRDNSRVDLGFLNVRRGKIPIDNILAQKHDQDSRFLRILSHAIEVFVTESLRALAKQWQSSFEHTSVSVYVGTRMVEAREQGDYTFQRDLEIHHFGNRSMLRSVNGASIYPVITEALRRHGIEGRIRIVRAVGVTLPYAGERKELMDRVVDRKTRQILSFDIFRDLSLQVNLRSLHGKILRMGVDNHSGGQWCDVRVPGLERPVRCFGRTPNDFENLKPRDFVELSATQNARGQYQGSNVTSSDGDQFVKWVENQNPALTADFVGQLDTSQMRPDYRALHYVADQVMRRGLEDYGLCDTRELGGQFDEDCEFLTSGLKASRDLDLNHLAGALRSFSFDETASRTYQRPVARVLIGSRIAKALESCSGQDIETALPQKVTSEGYDHKRLLIYTPRAGFTTERHKQSENASCETGKTSIAAEQIVDAASLASGQGKTLVFRSVSRNITVDALRGRLERYCSPRPQILKIVEVGDDSNQRDIHFHLVSESASKLQEGAKRIRNVGYKVDVLENEPSSNP